MTAISSINMQRTAPTSSTLPCSKLKVVLALLLIVAAALQAWVSLLHHSNILEDEIRKEEALLDVAPNLSWGKKNGKGGIDLLPLLKFVNDSASITGPSYEPNQPDDFYIILTDEETGNPTFQLSMNTYWKHPVSFRRRELTDGLNFIQSSIQERLPAAANNNATTAAWPRIIKAISNGNTIPLFINWDGTENCTNTCCDSGKMDPSGTLRLTDSVPVFRFVAPRNCRYRLLSPTGHVLKLASSRSKEEWTLKFQTNEKQHPYHQKVKRVVYRGKSLEVQTKLKAMNNNATVDVLDYNQDEDYDWDNFQKYVAVLDVDTLHYPQLMCQNSVVLKVRLYKSVIFHSFMPISRRHRIIERTLTTHHIAICNSSHTLLSCPTNHCIQQPHLHYSIHYRLNLLVLTCLSVPSRNGNTTFPSNGICRTSKNNLHLSSKMKLRSRPLSRMPTTGVRLNCSTRNSKITF
jgi:hypothetical protein